MDGALLIYALAQICIGDKMKVELIVDGKKIPMNKFVQKFVGSTTKGMVETLDDVDASWHKIEIVVNKEEE